MHSNLPPRPMVVKIRIYRMVRLSVHGEGHQLWKSVFLGNWPKTVGRRKKGRRKPMQANKVGRGKRRRSTSVVSLSLPFYLYICTTPILYKCIKCFLHSISIIGGTLLVPTFLLKVGPVSANISTSFYDCCFSFFFFFFFFQNIHNKKC